MIHISNLRTESSDGWTRLIADITQLGGGQNCLSEPIIWIAVKDEYAHMLADDVYDAFILVPLYFAMYYKQDLHIHGCVSKKLYKNVMNYLQRILCDFSDNLSRINITVDGFKVAEGNPDVIGAGISCGIDSLSTIYDWYIRENDPDYRINALFFFNNGWHGDCRNENTKKLCLERYNQNKPAADELDLPLYFIDSNFSAFVFGIYGLKYVVGRIGFFANYSCILGLQKGIRRYYASSGLSYTQIMKFGLKCREDDFSEFSESYSVPLIRTEKTEIIVDGCQYERTQKTKNIADWNIAQKYLNVCGLNSYDSLTAHNCSVCDKCMRTLTALDTLGKLDNFSGVFDIEAYKKQSFKYKCHIVLNKNKNALYEDNYNFAKAQGKPLPSYLTAYMYLFPSRLSRFLKRIMRKITRKRL